MSQTKYDYTKGYELDVLGKCLPNCWIVVKINGNDFYDFIRAHGYIKPIDVRGLHLMNRCSTYVMEQYADICFAYGYSDEYNFIFKKDTNMFDRRAHKILCAVVSLFTAQFVSNWRLWFAEELHYSPSFDGEVSVFPNEKSLKDYIARKQLSNHFMCLNNTAFFALVNKGLSEDEARCRVQNANYLQDRYEEIFSEVGVNFEEEPANYRLGTILLRKLCPDHTTRTVQERIIPFHEDLEGEGFWNEHFEVLGLTSLQIYPKGDVKRMKIYASSSKRQDSDD